MIRAKKASMDLDLNSNLTKTSLCKFSFCFVFVGMSCVLLYVFVCFLTTLMLSFLNYKICINSAYLPPSRIIVRTNN